MIMDRSTEIEVRPFRLSDAPSFLKAVQASRNELLYWMPWCHENYGAEDAESWMRFCQAAWQSRIEFPLGIFDVTTGDVIGGTGVNHINTTYKIGNLGYWVSTPFTGRGVAVAAAQRAINMGFTELGLTRLEILALTHNVASQRVAERLGAERECIAKNRLYFQGRPHDAVVFSITPQALTDVQ